jgi:hypothetical protein
MTTALLIVFAALVVLALVGVCCQICGGGFWAIYHLVFGTLGALLGLLGELLVEIGKGLKSN